MAYIFAETIYVIVYAGVRPHWDKQRTRLEIFNEVMIMYFNYHNVLFSDYCYNPNVQYEAGYSYITFLIILIFANLGFTAIKIIAKARRERLLRKLKKNQQMMAADHEQKQQKKKEKEEKARYNAKYQKAFIKRAMIPKQKPSPILPAFKLEEQIKKAKKERNALEVGLYEKLNLKDAISQHSQKSKLRKMKMELKKELLHPIPEKDEPDDYCEKEMRRMEHLSAEILKWEALKEAGEEKNPVMREFQKDAEQLLEAELQQRRKDHILAVNNREMFKDMMTERILMAKVIDRKSVV